MADSKSELILKATHVTKTFGTTKALSDVSFELRVGEVHALMGENGAGKSTLGKCITGIHKADSGEYEYAGKKVSYDSPKQALDDGIAIVLQEFNVIPHLSVAENIFLTDESFYKAKVFSNYEAMVKKTDEMLRYFRMREFIDPTDKMSSLSVAEMQIVEIIKAMSRNARVMILDEPTATLSAKEVGRLFEMIRELKSQGVAFIIVSHRINEIFEISDRITVLRDGQLVLANAVTGELTEMQLIKAMVGREIDHLYGTGGSREDKISEEKVLVASHISDTKGLVKDCSFYVRKGEILGVSGLIGAGRTELMRCLFGIDRRSAGTVVFQGKEIKKDSIIASIKAGMCYLSEKRKEEGLHQRLPIIHNLAMVKRAIDTRSIISGTKEESDAAEMIKKLSIKVSDAYDPVNSLSGGNQQKILVGKWLLSNPKLLIIDEPTRGIDIASKSEIYAILRELADTGISIVIISSEINEVLGVTDRIIVIRDGQVIVSLDTAKASEEMIGYYATIGNSGDTFDEKAQGGKADE